MAKENLERTGADAVGKDKNRPADDTTQKDTLEKAKDAPNGHLYKGMKESLEDMFSGEEFSEDFKAKITTIFEAALSAAIADREETLAEGMAAKLEEELKSIQEGIGTYMDYVAEQWLERNEMVLESSVKVQMAESFLSGVKGLVSEHNFDISEADIDYVTETDARYTEIKDKYNAVVESLMEANREITDLKEEKVFAEITENMADTTVDKLRRLTENMMFDDLNDYRKKVMSIKESFLTETHTPTDANADMLEESTSEPKKGNTTLDPMVNSFLNTIRNPQ